MNPALGTPSWIMLPFVIIGTTTCRPGASDTGRSDMRLVLSAPSSFATSITPASVVTR